MMRPRPVFPELMRDDVTEAEALEMQDLFRKRILLQPLAVPRTVTGVDIAYQTTSSVGAVAVAVTMRLPSFTIIETAQVSGACSFPYIPGLLGFREVNLISRALQTLDQPIDIVLYDGHGIAHPRRFGAASQLGLAFGIPSIGCAKNMFYGVLHGTLAPEKYATSTIQDNLSSDIIGVAMRLQENVNPVYISPGHLVDLDSTIAVMKCCANGFRLPEPIRQADAIARKQVRFFED